MIPEAPEECVLRRRSRRSRIWRRKVLCWGSLGGDCGVPGVGLGGPWVPSTEPNHSGPNSGP
eukprot:11394759-Alexandrium_andersonii.AAC.1